MRDNAPANDSSHEGRSALGRCPRCGSTVIETAERYACEKSLSEIGPCPFRIGKIVLGQPLDRRQVQLLLTTGRTELLHKFISKSGRTFSARLTIDETAKVVFEFPPSPAEVASEPAAQTLPEKPSPEQPSAVLLEAATPNLFTQNAFRITGLPVDATMREIAKHTEKLKIMHELGQAEVSNQHAFPLNPPPTLYHIRDAIQHLKDAERRIIDEFFWFWPSEFGRGHSDPAIQALASGDAQAALHQWQSSQSKGQHGAVARHNLAVFWHLTALEWENKSLNGGVDDGTLRDIKSYWKQAFQYWDDLLHEDGLWDIVANRIRQIDDPRLTSGFAHRIRATLPQAFDKINGELAISYVDAKKHELARFHVDFMRQKNQGIDDIENTAELVLSPARKQLREQLIAAKRTADEAPATANEAGHSLLHSAQPILELFDLFYGTGRPTRDDIFDEVAATSLTCAIAHQRATSDDNAFVSLLCKAVPLAASEDLRIRIEKNIDIAKGNIALAELQPVRDTLDEITKSKDPIRAKFLRLRNEVLPHLQTFDAGDSSAKEALERCFSDVAWAFRTLSIDAHNDDGDTELALEMIELAREFGRNPDLQKKIAEDIKQLTQIKQNQDSHNLILSIRDDQVEINAKKVRYNSAILPVSDITGIQFGIFRHYTNGIKTSTSYTIGLASASHGTISIECKRFFRSEDQAEKDFNAILNSLFYHVVPELCTRIAKSIAGGHPQPLGDSLLTSDGIRTTVGVLLWKENVLIPWPVVRFGSHQGHLNLSSSQNKKFSKSYSLRDVWNAVIFEQIAKSLFKLHS
jgi:hypothetical protein